jgi:arylsulfatase A-like enzyme
MFKNAILAISSTFCLVLLAAGLAKAAPSDGPNVVLILVDDLGYGDLGCYGATQVRTPHLDALMASGMRFDRFYANCTVCSPTRASLITGLYPDKAGVPGVIRQHPQESWGYLDPKAVTLPHMLKQAGYHTAMIGKWHLGFESPNIPNDRGFDLFEGYLADMMDDYWTHLRGGVNWMRKNREEIDPKGHATEIFSQWAVDYISGRAADQADTAPFFLYLAYNAPHFPIQPPEEYLEKVRLREPGLSLRRATNIAFVEHLDAGIGRVLDSIKSAGIAKETLIIFSSDNGGSLPHGASNGELRGGKQDHWEGGIRVPTCAVWPAKIPVRRSDELGMTMDFLPTLCEIAGVSIDHSIDGRSLAPILLRDGKGDPQRPMIWVRREGNPHYQGRAYYAIRRGKWKLEQSDPFGPMQLVDLEADPFEKNPLPAKGEIAEDLARLLMNHIQEAGRISWQP